MQARKEVARVQAGEEVDESRIQGRTPGGRQLELRGELLAEIGDGLLRARVGQRLHLVGRGVAREQRRQVPLSSGARASSSLNGITQILSVAASAAKGELPIR
jgi:hypothetical protein